MDQYTPSYVISIIDSVPDSLSATEQSNLITSPASNTTLPPDNNSSEVPCRNVNILYKKDVPFATLFAPARFDVVLTNSTSAVTAVV